MVVQSTYRGERTFRRRLYDLFENAGHCDFESRQLAKRFDCSMTIVARYKRHWEEHQDQTRGPQCRRCEFYGWEKSPILEDGMCLWCHLESAGIDLSWWAREVGWD